MLGNVDGTVEHAVGVVVGALVVLEIEEVQIDVELACVHQLDERRVELAVHRGAAGAQRFHVDGYGGSPLGFLAIPFVGDYEAGLVVGVSRLGTDFLELAIGLVHGHAQHLRQLFLGQSPLLAEFPYVLRQFCYHICNPSSSE